MSLIGPNGAGKTTLIAALAGRRELDGGKLRRGHNLKLGVLSQHADELDSTATVLEAAQRATGLTPNKARALLGQFLFGGEAAEKPVDGLSGGERRRLSLAILVHSGANVLILDEPTNHLDLESREALEGALQAFPGAVLLISHDRALLDAVGTRTVAVEEGTLHSYVGGWAEYLRVREERAEAEKAARSAAAKQRKRAKAAHRPQQRRPLEEPAARCRAPRGRHRGRRGGAALARGGARGSGRVERPARVGEVDPPPRGRQAPPRGALRGLGGDRVLTRWSIPRPLCGWRDAARRARGRGINPRCAGA